MKVKILINDVSGRFKQGEIGEILENDFPEKYDYFIELPGEVDLSFLGFGIVPRRYYFYRDEVNEIDVSNEDLDK